MSAQTEGDKTGKGNTMTKTYKEELKSHLRHIIETIEHTYNVTIGNEDMTDDEKERYEDEHEMVEDTIFDTLDTVYKVGHDGSFRGVSFMVAYGGPTIWVDAHENYAVVRGSWGIHNACDDNLNPHAAMWLWDEYEMFFENYGPCAR